MEKVSKVHVVLLTLKIGAVIQEDSDMSDGLVDSSIMLQLASLDR
jgi:hypothetical protein